MKTKLEIILVKYNRPDMEANTISAVLATTQYPNYTLTAYQNERGVGLSKCWNRLIAASDAEYIVLLNTDTVPTPGWLDEMVHILEQGHDVAAVVPSSNRTHLAMVDIPFDHAELSRPVIFEEAAKLPLEKGAYRVLPTGSAMCVLFRRKTWQNVGGFDTDYHFYGEDTDFLYRVSKFEGVVAWAHGAYVHHYGQQSFIKAERDGELDYQQVRTDAGNLWARKQAEIDVA